MEISQNLLVAIMFVMVLSISIGNILMGLSGLLHRESGIQVHWMPMTWLVLLLLIHFQTFWQTLDLVSVENWRFAEFLYVISGPVALLFATNLMLPESSRGAEGDYRAHYFHISDRFFSLLALVMLWAVGTDLIFRDGMGIVSWVDLGQAVLLGTLALSRREQLHTTLTGVACAIWLIDFAIQGFVLSGS